MTKVARMLPFRAEVEPKALMVTIHHELGHQDFWHSVRQYRTYGHRCHVLPQNTFDKPHPECGCSFHVEHTNVRYSSAESLEFQIWKSVKF